MAQELRVKIVGDPSSYKRALGQATQSGTRFGAGLARIGKLAAVGLGVAGVAAGAAGVKMISLASDAAEMDSKFKIIFGKSVPKLTKNINAFSEATGTSRFELKAQVADLGALLKPIMGSTDATGKMSVAVTKLATDLGSFNNVPTADALLAIRSGLVGEAEPLRRFGVLLNAAAVEAEGLRLGLVKKGETMTEAQKVQARYSLIMKQTSIAQGDATRTSGSFANQLKRLKANVRDTATDLGVRLLPAAGAVLDVLNKIGRAKGFTAKVRVAFASIKTAVADLQAKLKKMLYGSTTKKLIRAPTGRIIDWEVTRQEGLIAAISAGLKGADWSAIGKQVGEGISAKIKFTWAAFESLINVIDAHVDEFAELGAKIALHIISKLLDPGFWARNWQVILGIAIAVFPMGKVAGLGFKAAKALLAPIARLLPEGFRTIGSRAVTFMLTQLGRLPGAAQRIILAVIGKMGELVSYVQGTLKTALDKVPGWVTAAFKIGVVLSMINAVKTLIGWVEDLIGKLKDAASLVPGSRTGTPSAPGVPGSGAGGGQMQRVAPTAPGSSVAAAPGGITLVINSNFPPTEQQIQGFGEAAARAFRSQGYRPAPRIAPGI